MARRRLNTKLFAIVLATLVVGGGGLLAWTMFFKPGADPVKLEAAADENMAAALAGLSGGGGGGGTTGPAASPAPSPAESAAAAARGWQAVQGYQKAAVAAQNNPTPRRKLGEALIRLRPDLVADQAFPNELHDPWMRVRRAHEAWQDAAQLDANLPDTKRSLELLVDSLWEGVEVGMADTMVELPRWAERLLAADPGNTRVAVLRHAATVKLWLSGQAVQDKVLEESEAALRELSGKDPANAEAPYALAMIKIRRARTAAKDQLAGPAAENFNDAVQIIEKALAGQEGNAPMQYYGYLVYANLSVFDKPNEAKYQERVGKCIAAAMAAVRPDTPQLESIYVAAADWQARTGQAAEARKTRKAFYESHPDNQRARITWAWQLAGDKAERPQAIAILAKEVLPPKSVVGVGILLHQRLVVDTLGDLVRVRLLDIESEPDATKRSAVIAAADADMDKLRKLKAGNDPRVMAIEGRVLYAKGKTIEAVQALEAAYSAMKTNQSRKDHESLLVLAQIHARTRQPGRAIEVCEDIIKDNPGSHSARLMLARLLLAENRVADAHPHVAVLAKALPDNGEVKQLGNQMVMLLAKNEEFIKKYYPDLPEKTGADRRFKYEVARLATLPDEQVRLLVAILEAEPGDVPATLALAGLYKQRQLPGRAIEVVSAALKLKPDDFPLRTARAELSGETSDQIVGRLVERINAEPDAYKRNLQLYDLYKRTGKDAATTLGALKAAHAVNPDGVEAHRALFAEHLARGQFDAAVPHRDFLVKAGDDGFGGRLTRHQFHVAKGEFEAALAIGDEMATKYADFAPSWFARGQAQEALGQWAAAIESFNKVLALQPANYAAMRALVDTYYNDGQTDQAKARLKEMKRVFPEDVVVRELYLEHLANFGEPEQAIPERETLLKKAAEDKSSKDPWPYLALAATYFKNAQRLSAMNDKGAEVKADIEKAFQTLLAGRNKFPDDTRFYAQVAEIHQYNNDLAAGEKVLKDYGQQELTKQPPAVVRPDPWLALADFYNRSGQGEQAVAALEQALQRSGDNLDIRLKLVSAMVQAKQYAEAAKRLDAVADNPDPRIARQKLEILVAQGSHAEAEQAIRAALQNRDAADLRNLMASVLIDTGRPADALVELERALRLERGNETARYLEALALSRHRPPRVPEAIDRLDKLKNLNPRNVQARLLLADLQNRNGQRSLAMQQLGEGLEKMPGSRELRLALISLYRQERPPNFAKAEALITQAENDPVMKTDPTWPREAAFLYLDLRRPQEAVIKMGRASQLAPGNVDYRRELIELQMKFGDFVGAVIGTDRMLTEGMDTWWLRFLRAQAQAKQITPRLTAQAATDPKAAQAIQDLRREAMADFDRALAALDSARTSQGNLTPFAAALNADQIDSVLRTIGTTIGYDQALERLGRRLGDDPDRRWARLSVLLKRMKGDVDGAAVEVDRLLADPANAYGPGGDEAHKQRRMAVLQAAAEVYQAKNPPDHEKTKQCYLEMLQHDPSNLAALNNLAFLLAESIVPPDPQAAKVHSAKAYQITSAADQNGLIIDTHGWVLVLCGGADAEAGLGLLKGVVERSPYFVEGRYHLAEAYLRQPTPDNAKAVKELQECLRLIDEEKKLKLPVNEKLEAKVQTALGRIREGGR